MEDVLGLYELPYNPKRPLVCFDERPCQLLGELLTPLPMQPGQPQREDYQYQRNGTCTLFVAFEPLAGKRIVQVRRQRTRCDYAEFMKELADVHYPEADTIVLIQDNLNTHSAGSFYEAFTAEEAYRLSTRFENHYTPKKGSWLNMVEIELSVFAKQCLDRRIGDQTTLEREVQALAQERNRIRATVQWSFTKQNARQKLRRHYAAVMK